MPCLALCLRLDDNAGIESKEPVAGLPLVETQWLLRDGSRSALKATDRTLTSIQDACQTSHI
jgi:hypothetical protein